MAPAPVQFSLPARGPKEPPWDAKRWLSVALAALVIVVLLGSGFALSAAWLGRTSPPPVALRATDDGFEPLAALASSSPDGRFATYTFEVPLDRERSRVAPSAGKRDYVVCADGGVAYVVAGDATLSRCRVSDHRRHGDSVELTTTAVSGRCRGRTTVCTLVVMS